MSERPKFTWMADDDAALMYRVDCYKGNATDPLKREAFSDEGYKGFLAGAAFKEVQMRERIAEADARGYAHGLEEADVDALSRAVVHMINFVFAPKVRKAKRKAKGKSK